jgi:hypothetical protein
MKAIAAKFGLILFYLFGSQSDQGKRCISFSMARRHMMESHAVIWPHGFKELKEDLSCDLAMECQAVSLLLNLPNSGFPVKFNRNLWGASVPSRSGMVGDIFSPRSGKQEEF